MRMKPTVLLIPFALSLLLISAAYSHDIWLLPERFTLSRGETLTVYQLVGHELDIELILPLRKEMTTGFRLITSDGFVDLLSELADEIHPVLKKLDFEGLALLAMEHDYLSIEHSDEKFSEYLEHEEFKEIQKLRAQIGHRPEERERYARALKSLIQVGEVAEGDLYKEPVGQKLEILLTQNPYLLDPGDDLEVQVIFDGEPLSDARVMAYNGKPKRLVSKSESHTDSRGIARFKMEREGSWLIRVVHLLPCSDDCSDADWESHWATYTFELD